MSLIVSHAVGKFKQKTLSSLSVCDPATHTTLVALLYQGGIYMDDKIMENVRNTSIYRNLTSEIGITNMKCILFSD